MAKYSPEEIKRLDDRMAEMDRLRSDPTMKLVRNKSGKFQYTLKEPELKSLSNKSTAKSKPAASKPASDAYKPGTSSGPISRPKLSPESDVYKPGTSSGPLKRPNLSTPTPYRTRGLGVSSEGAREELQALSNRTSPRTPVKTTPQSLDAAGQAKVRAYEDKMDADAEKVKKGRAVGAGLALTLAPELAALRPAMALGPRVARDVAYRYMNKEAMGQAPSLATRKALRNAGERGARRAERQEIEDTVARNVTQREAARRAVQPKPAQPKPATSSRPLDAEGKNAEGYFEVSGLKKGGKVGESKGMVKKEVEFFKKKKAPKAMIKHEMSEMKKESGMRKMAKGGMSCMKKGGDVQKFAKGGSIDGCAVRGKTKLKRVKM